VMGPFKIFWPIGTRSLNPAWGLLEDRRCRHWPVGIVLLDEERHTCVNDLPVWSTHACMTATWTEIAPVTSLIQRLVLIAPPCTQPLFVTLFFRSRPAHIGAPILRVDALGVFNCKCVLLRGNVVFPHIF